MRRIVFPILVATLLAAAPLACSDAAPGTWGTTPFDGQEPLVSGTIGALTPGLAIVDDAACGASVSYDNSTVVYHNGQRGDWRDLRVGQRVDVFGNWDGPKPCPPPAHATGIQILQ